MDCCSFVVCAVVAAFGVAAYAEDSAVQWFKSEAGVFADWYDVVGAELLCGPALLAEGGLLAQSFGEAFPAPVVVCGAAGWSGSRELAVVAAGAFCWFTASQAGLLWHRIGLSFGR